MDHLKDFGTIISLILALVSIVSVIYSVAVWRTKLDGVLKACKKCAEATPTDVAGLKGQLGTLQTKMDLVWQLQTAEVIERQKLGVHVAYQEVQNPFPPRPAHPGDDSIAQAHSPYKLTDRGEECLKDVQFLFDDPINKMTASGVPVYVAEKVGLAKIAQIARENGMTPSELMAVITVKLGFGL
jgi:hypothetical protein